MGRHGGWNAKTLVDDESDADTMAAVESKSRQSSPNYSVPSAGEVTKKHDCENGSIYSPVLTVSAGTPEFSTFTLGLPVRP
jgi:hypothetical protein